MSEYLDLYDYRHRMATLYHERSQAFVAGADAELTLQRFRADKNALFARHPQSALDATQRQHFQGLRYFPYNPAMHFTVTIDTTVTPIRQRIAMNAEESMDMVTMGRVHFTIADTPVTLDIYWLDIYGGGLFLPFRDATCSHESYGGGRYLFDTIKGSDPLPALDDTSGLRITLDFNYAYNPSCAYNDRWFCPLAPAENHLNVAIPAGEMNYKHEQT